MSFQKNKIISLNISDLSYSQTTDEILRLAKAKSSSYVCFANVHMTIEAYDNPLFAEMVNSANIVCADGMPLVKAIKLKYKKNIDRVAGMDMLPTILEKAQSDELRVFFYGTSNDTLNLIERKINEKYSKLNVVGYFSPPFKKLTEDEQNQHIDIINKSNPNIVFVALGCPKQEMWMAKNFKNINAVLLGIGGALPVFAGAQKRAPEWMRKSSLEWLFRLLQDPKRLFKRYFYTNSKFIYLMALELILKRK